MMDICVDCVLMSYSSRFISPTNKDRHVSSLVS